MLASSSARSSEATPALAVEGVSFAYRRDAPPTLRAVSFEVPVGQTVAVMGASGCGKTTLLRVLAGVRRPTAGQVRLPAGIVPRRGVVGYIPQQLGLVRNRSAIDNVLVGALCRTGTFAGLLGRFRAAEVEAAHRVLERVGLASKADVPVGSLSGGERQRVAIARTVLQRPAVLLADEFTANLDVVKAGQILDIVREATARGVATLVALHNVELAREYTDRVLFMRDGAIALDVPASKVTLDLAREYVA